MLNEPPNDARESGGPSSTTSLASRAGRSEAGVPATRPGPTVEEVVPTAGRPGSILLDRYLIEGRLGRGGMGDVWLARHVHLGVWHAVKTIAPGGAASGEILARFGREARLMAEVRHPNVVAVHDAGFDGGGTAYIVMDYVRGRSLDALMVPGRPMPLGWTARLLVQLCDALQAAHDRGIVHRDIKPTNLMVSDATGPARGPLRVLDFGIAKALGRGGIAPDGLTTCPGQYFGTPAYSSPEQATGGPVDERSDLYSVGVLLYQLLTGRLPFSGPRVIHNHIYAEPPPFSRVNPDASVPAGVEGVVIGCLAKDPAGRPGTAAELAREFLDAARPRRALRRGRIAQWYFKSNRVWAAHR